MATIRIEGLSKSFRDGEQIHRVLDGLDLEMSDGQFVALLGRSGSGKSTLLNCLAGIETPDEGSITIDGIEITALRDRDRTRLRRDRIGIVFQFFNLLPMLPVLENVAMPALLRGRARAEVFERAHALLDELGLADRASEMPDHLSGGEQQRVATARALINEPAILLADEPTGNLDAETATRTLQLLRDVNERHGVTVLMVTHSDEAAATATRMAHLVSGRIEWPDDDSTATQPEDTDVAADVEVDGEADAPDDADASADEVVDAVLDESPPDATPSAAKLRPSAKAAALFEQNDDPKTDDAS